MIWVSTTFDPTIYAYKHMYESEDGKYRVGLKSDSKKGNTSELLKEAKSSYDRR